jgi:sugar lactone lactonase YvrE
VRRLSAVPLDVPRAALGESPRWHAGRLHWVDILGHEVASLDPDSGAIARTAIDDMVSLVWPRAGGGRLLAIGAALVLEDPDGSLRTLAALDDADRRCNDGAFAPDGSFYVGTMRRDTLGREGTLWRVAADGSAEALLRGLGVSNGIGFDLVRGLTYYVDSRDERVDLLDLTTGRREPFVDIDEGGALPDGLAVDAAGRVWVALYGAGRVHAYDPDGRLDIVVDVGVPNVTSCTFGGPDLTDLYITTARENMSPADLERMPDAGAVYRVDGAGHGQALVPYTE